MKYVSPVSVRQGPSWGSSGAATGWMLVITREPVPKMERQGKSSQVRYSNVFASAVQYSSNNTGNSSLNLLDLTGRNVKQCKLAT